HARPRRNDNHVRRLQTAQDAVQILEASRQPNWLTFVIDGVFQRLPRFKYSLLKGRNFTGNHPLGNSEYLALSIVNDQPNFFLRLITTCRDLSAGKNKTAKLVFFMDDRDVILGIGRCRDERIQMVQVMNSADFLKLIATFQSLAQRNEINRPIFVP